MGVLRDFLMVVFPIRHSSFPSNRRITRCKAILISTWSALCLILLYYNTSLLLQGRYNIFTVAGMIASLALLLAVLGGYARKEEWLEWLMFDNTLEQRKVELLPRINVLAEGEKILIACGQLHNSFYTDKEVIRTLRMALSRGVGVEIIFEAGNLNDDHPFVAMAKRAPHKFHVFRLEEEYKLLSHFMVIGHDTVHVITDTTPISGVTPGNIILPNKEMVDNLRAAFYNYLTYSKSLSLTKPP